MDFYHHKTITKRHEPSLFGVQLVEFWLFWSWATISS